MELKWCGESGCVGVSGELELWKQSCAEPTIVYLMRLAVWEKEFCLHQNENMFKWLLSKASVLLIRSAVA